MPGLSDAEAIHAACRELVAAGWLIPPTSGGTTGRGKASYAVNAKVYEAAA